MQAIPKILRYFGWEGNFIGLNFSGLRADLMDRIPLNTRQTKIYFLKKYIDVQMSKKVKM